MTKDLPGSDDLRESYPTFFQVVLPEDSRPSLLSKARREGLEEMDAGFRLPAAMKAWQDHLIRIIPDPADARKADYREQAEWMKALYELNRNDCKTLLARWHDIHNRRRNLWRDMKEYNLPV